MEDDDDVLVLVSGDGQSGVFNMGLPAAEVLWHVGTQLEDNIETVASYILRIPSVKHDRHIYLEVKLAEGEAQHADNTDLH